MKKVAIVGGGVSGLSVAFYLQEAVRGHFCNSRSVPIACPPLEITLIEASDRLGGMIKPSTAAVLSSNTAPICF